MAFGKKTRRGARYYTLRNQHFTPKEAAEFSKLSRKYPALQRLVASRRALWANFSKEADQKGWESENKRKTEWLKKVGNFYTRQRRKRKTDRKTGLSADVLSNWVVKKDVHGKVFKTPKISPWEWYDWVFQRLPDNLKWDTPRSHRSKQADVKVNVVMVHRWIADIQKSIDRTNDPKRKKQLTAQIANLRTSIRKKRR